MLTLELIKEFQNIIREEYGIKLSNQDATKIANNFAGYFDLLAKIHHRECKNAEAPDLVRPNGLNQGL